MLGISPSSRTVLFGTLSCQVMSSMRQRQGMWKVLSFLFYYEWRVHESLPYRSVLKTQALYTRILVFSVSFLFFFYISNTLERTIARKAKYKLQCKCIWHLMDQSVVRSSLHRRKRKKRKKIRNKQSAFSICSHCRRNFCNRLLKDWIPRVIYNTEDVVRQAALHFKSAMDKSSSWRVRSWLRLFQGIAWHTQACAGFSYWAVGSRKYRFQIKREQTGVHPVQECRNCNLPPVIKRKHVQFRSCFFLIFVCWSILSWWGWVRLKMVVAALPLRLFSSVSRQRKSVRDCRAKLKVRR